MKIRFWGTRGSIPSPGPETVRYGGNTSCIELRSEAGTLIVFDCGTGARALGRALLDERSGGQGAVLVGHTHWDHIHGLPFFAPLFQAGERWSLYGPRGLGRSLQDTLAGQMEYTYFPVALDSLGAEVTYQDLVEGEFAIDDIAITTQYLNHPALTIGFRLVVDGWTVVYASDHEPFDPSLGGGGDLRANQGDARHLEFLRGADVVIHDAQYLAAEYGDRIGWGHSPMEYVVDAAVAAGVGTLVLHHHDPARTDDEVDALLTTARARAAAQHSALEIVAAAEGAGLERAARATALRAVAATSALVHGPAAAAALVAIDEPMAAAAVRAAAAQEELALAESSGDGESLVMVVDADHAPEAARGAFGSDTVVVGITTTLPVPSVPQVSDWIVWPASIAHVRTKLRAAALRRACRWLVAPRAVNEEDRLAALHGLGLLDTAPEERFDALTREATATFQVPIALITLVDADRQWFKARCGIDIEQGPLDDSMCAHAILEPDVLIISDLLTDDRFADSPQANGDGRVRFYAGVPLRTEDGSAVGTFCIADHRPRALSADGLAELKRLAARAETELRR